MLEVSSTLYVNEHSAYAARLSCGGAIELCDAVGASVASRMDSQSSVRRNTTRSPRRAWLLLLQQRRGRNAGRHATTCQHQEVLILDWDVHHGNGTQSVFENDPNVLYISIHRYDEDGSFYPRSTYGDYTSVGSGMARATRSTSRGPRKAWAMPTTFMHSIISSCLLPSNLRPTSSSSRPDSMQPKENRIGQCKVTPGGYAQMTLLLNSLCDGKVAVVL